eukprot:GEZU01013212.1.p1 GENE.GEZU01013212.1~~GEZU01013212.1.p1  ORF type:complete len:191 (+),score=46.46 GEZU01013212.1:108-680(+)
MSEKKKDFDPPIFIGSSMFGGDSSDEEDSTAENQLEADATRYEIKTHNYAGETIRIREFDFHQTNANFVWPASKTLAEFMVAPENLPLFQNKTIIELGCGTGILSVFLKKKGLNVCTSDYADPQITENVSFNFKLNGIEDDQVVHFPYTWGNELPEEMKKFDVIIGSDILLCTYSMCTTQPNLGSSGTTH